MTEFIFFSTGLNSNNVMFSKNELDLETYAYRFTTENEFVPMAETFFTPQIADISMLNNVDYCYVKNADREYYLFIDGIVPSTTSIGYVVSFTVDIWNTFNCNDLIINNRLNIKAQLEQGHVNDFVADENNNSIAHPTLIYTNDNLEAPLMKDGLVFTRKPEEWVTITVNGIPKKYAYLYCMINAGADGAKVLSGYQQYLEYYYENENTKANVKSNIYRTVVFAVCLDDFSLCGIYETSKGITVGEDNFNHTLTDINVIAGQSGNTNFGVVSMYISVIPPNPRTSITLYNSKVYLTINDKLLEFKGYKDVDGKYFGKDLHGIIPVILQQEKIFYTPNDLYYITSTVNKSNLGENSRISFENYINNYIVKSHTTVYNKYFIVVDNNTSEIETFETYNREVTIQFEPTLTYVSIDTPQVFKKGYTSKKFLELYSTFEPIYNNSYWQRRNAEMSTMSAQFAVANSVIGTTFNAIENGVNIYSTSKSKPEKLPGAIIEGVGNFAKGVSSIVENSINLAYISEKNNAIIQSGVINNTETNLGSFYMANSGISELRISLTEYCKEQVNMYLHIYGYSSDIVITEKFFTEHKRLTFNYIKCSNAIVSGSSALVCRYIETLLLSGVTFWHRLENNHINYASNNVQVNI